MTEKLTMYNLYQRLKDIGFSKKFVRAIGLPSWWVDELDEKNTAVLEAAGHISERLFIDLKSLLDVNQKVKFKENITKENVLTTLKGCKGYLINYPLTDEEIQKLSDDKLDYYEQLLLLDI